MRRKDELSSSKYNMIYGIPCIYKTAILLCVSLTKRANKDATNAIYLTLVNPVTYDKLEHVRQTVHIKQPNRISNIFCTNTNQVT